MFMGAGSSKQGQGIGQRLIGRGRRIFAEEEFNRVYLVDICSLDPARRLYENLDLNFANNAKATNGEEPSRAKSNLTPMFLERDRAHSRLSGHKIV